MKSGFTGALWGVMVGLLAVVAGTQRAAACGCFAPPDPTVPVLQAGENILFAVSGGQVTAHIQIQYSGEAGDFGWLLPLPSVPTLEVGSDELFTDLTESTRPRYHERVVRPDNCDMAMAAAPDFGQQRVPSPDFSSGQGGTPDPNDPLVVQGGVGPYDYAVLKADSRKAMLDWLAKNRYFVPGGTDGVVTPYIHPGAYFLALKLQSGKASGDIQPVVIHYASDLPMIPIVLTSVTATPNLGIWVWVLGPGRAIPRNYHHAILDDAALDWDSVEGASATPSNYELVVSHAVKSTPERRAFITELATPVAALKAQLFSRDRFGDLGDLRAITDAGEYLSYLRGHGFTFSQTLLAILKRYIPQPPSLRGAGGGPVSPASYYYNFDFWYRTRPDAFMGFDLGFDAAALTDELDTRIVKPVRDAAALFDGATHITRLHSWLAPADMTEDPVFSFNASLPDVPGAHEATLTLPCSDRRRDDAGRLVTEHGFVIDYRRRPLPLLPWASRVEILRESGPPEVVADYSARIRALLALPVSAIGEGEAGSLVASGGGCAVAAPATPLGWRIAVGIGAMGLLALLRRRRLRRVGG